VFLVQKSFQQVFSSYVLAKKALSYKKLARKMLMKLTPGGSKRIEELSRIWGLILGSSQVTKSIVANLESNLKILLLSA